jgi:hypothetical protein
MNKEALLKVAEEILFFDYLEKQAAGIDLKKNYKEINKAFTNYITSRMFQKGNKKVPYTELDAKEKERVWAQFWDSVADQYKSLEREVEDTIEKFKLKPSYSR